MTDSDSDSSLDTGSVYEFMGERVYTRRGISVRPGDMKIVLSKCRGRGDLGRFLGDAVRLYLIERGWLTGVGVTSLVDDETFDRPEPKVIPAESDEAKVSEFIDKRIYTVRGISVIPGDMGIILSKCQGKGDLGRFLGDAVRLYIMRSGWLKE